MAYEKIFQSRTIWLFRLFALVIIAAFLTVNPALAEEGDRAGLRLEKVWSYDGGGYGSDFKLEPTLAITPEHVLVAGFIPKGDRQHQVIRAFDIESGEPGDVLNHPDARPFDGFGEAVAANDHFVVTVLHRKHSPEAGGQLLVYDAKTLKLLRRIENPRAEESAWFGIAGLALDGERILVSVSTTRDRRASAWVFSAETGEILLTIDEPNVPENGHRLSYFGHTIAMNETHIAIASNGHSGPTALYARGEVWVFDAKDGSLQYKLDRPASEKATMFGRSLVLSDGRLHASSLGETGPLNWPLGRVHSYDLDSGELLFTLEDRGAPTTTDEILNGVSGEGFPSGLIGGRNLLISALPDWPNLLAGQGGLVVLDGTTGDHLLTYHHEAGQENARFGRALAVGYGFVAVAEEVRTDKGLIQRVTLYRLFSTD